MHSTIKKVTEDIEAFSFNTAISQMMIFVNAFANAETIPVSAMRTFLTLLNPFAPHLTSELWEKLNIDFKLVRGDITEQKWPIYDEALLAEDEIEIPVQVNGKFQGVLNVSVAATKEEIINAAEKLPKVKQRITDGYIEVLVVPNKVVNFVTK